MRGNKRAAIKRDPLRASSAKPGQKDIQRLVALYNSGQLKQAEAKARKLIRVFPGILVLYDFLSAAQVGQGKLEDAARSCQHALKVNPDHVGAHSNLGVIFRKLGRLDDAISSCRKVLDIDHGHVEARINLGVALRTMGRLDEAVACYQKALAVQPDSIPAHTNLGNALRDLGRFDDAVASHREAVRLNPGAPEAHCNLGNSLRELGDIEDAVASYEHALEIDPAHSSALNNLGAIYERMNDIEKAADYTRKALDIAPDEPGIILLWSVLLRRMKRPAEAIQMLEPLADKAFGDAIQIQLHSELGKLHDLAKDTTKAFGHFSAANELQAGREVSGAVDKQAFLGQIDQMSETLTAEWTRSWTLQEDNLTYETPAFLVGFPRSGTTLLDQIMDAHPGVQVMEERPPLHDVAFEIMQKFGDYPARISMLDGAAILELRELYFRKAGSYIERKKGTLLVDKMPLHIRHLPLILRLFPKARIILALRHPCDVVLSNFMQHYTINEAMANFFTLEDAAHCYAKVMSLWQRSARLLPMDHHVIKYESLIDDFDSEVRNLLEFLGVGWDDSVRSFNQHARERGTINTPSYQSVSEPINHRARYRWKRYEDQLAPVMDDLAPFIDAFGYSAP